jgi:hypothetical protein
MAREARMSQAMLSLYCKSDGLWQLSRDPSIVVCSANWQMALIARRNGRSGASTSAWSSSITPLLVHDAFQPGIMIYDEFHPARSEKSQTIAALKTMSSTNTGFLPFLGCAHGESNLSRGTIIAKHLGRGMQIGSSESVREAAEVSCRTRSPYPARLISNGLK